MDNKRMKRKGENPKRLVPDTEPSTRTCKNPACRAVLSVYDTFCRRCSCCICHSYDDNKDPTLWLECSPSSPASSCGLSCHIECALEHGKAGVINAHMTQLDGYYWCASCGQVSEILGCLKKQLTVTKGCQRVEILCYRILLCFMLLDGTRRFQDLHKIVKEAKDKLETEVGPLARVSPQQARGIISGLPIAGEVQALCLSAIRKADEVQRRGQTVNPDTPNADGSQSTSHGLDPNTTLNAGASPETDSSRTITDNQELLDLNVDAAAPEQDSSRDEGDNGNDGSGNEAQPGPDVEAVELLAEAPRERAHEGDNEGAGQLEQNFEHCVRVIRGLECENLITPEFRLKLLTWFCFRATERECRVVRAYIQAFMDEPRILADQLTHSFTHFLHR